MKRTGDTVGEVTPDELGALPVEAGTPTHCPYCALQCGMTLQVSSTGAVSVEARDFPTNRGGLCQKGWTSAELLASPERLTTPLVRAGRRARRDHVGRRARHGGRGDPSHPADPGRDAVGVFGGGGLTNEKAYALGKFARVALRSRSDRLQRPVLHVVGRCRRQPRLRDRPGTAVPALRPRDGRRGRAGRGEPGRDDAADGAPPRRHAAAGGRSWSSTRGRRRPRAGRRSTCRSRPGTDLALALGLLHVVVADGCRRHGLRGRPHRRASTPSAPRRRVLAGARRAGHRRTPPTSCAVPRDCSPRWRGSSCSRRAAPSSTARAPTP